MKPRRGDRGVALLLAVSMVLLLVVLVGSMVISASYSRTLSENYLDDLQNTYALRSAYHYALLYLRVDASETPNVDTLHEPWAQPLELEVGKARVTITIIDAERRFNLARLLSKDGGRCDRTRDQAEKLFQTLDQDPDLAERIADYIDADSTGSYEQGASNRLLFTLDELLRVQGFSREILYGEGTSALGDGGAKPLQSYVTVWPRDAASCNGMGDLSINANTATGEVLQSLADGMTEEMADEIIRWREEADPSGNPNAFKSIRDVKDNISSIDSGTLDELSKSLVFKSTVFLIHAESRLKNLSKAWVYVVRRQGGNRPYALLAQYRKNDLKEFPEPGE